MNTDYNATLIGCRDVHAGLRILRVQPDAGVFDFAPGQYTTLGLPAASAHLLKRPYSISCTLLTAKGQLVVATRCPYLEFYVARVGSAYGPTAGGLSPRLFELSLGDRLYCGPRAHGHYTLAPVRPGDDVVLLATGTGEAPHNAMIAELLDRGHEGRIVCATCVRYRRDLGYLEAHAELVRRYVSYRYVPLTTREVENIDSSRADYVGKQYLQDFVARGRLEEMLGGPLDPARTHIYLCGNPAMVGVPSHVGGVRQYPQPRGMIELLEARGFHADEPGRAGNIHFENYWQPHKEKADALP